MRKFSLLSFLAMSFLGISCSPNSQKEVPVLDLKDLIVDTLYLEKDTLTKNLGANFNYVKSGDEEFLLTSRQHRFMRYSYPEGKLIRD